MTFLRFALWNFGMKVCDHVPFHDRVPWCLYLHGVTFRGQIPDSWWARFGW